MPLPKLSLQVLEAFEQVARSGSMQQAAQELGLSISSVSHHVARLENELGVVLLDRTSRPFSLTREGREALHHLMPGLQHIRRATSETVVSGLLGARSLRVGFVEDFENNLAPDLAVILAGRMPRAKLSIRNVLSHEAPDLLRRGELDLAIVSAQDGKPSDLPVLPLLKDPFVMLSPRDSLAAPEEMVGGRSGLPFLRFNPGHQIGRQIEAHLTRHRIALPERFTFDTVESIMAVVGSGGGWSIISALGHARGRRFAERIRLAPLPTTSLARRICLMTRGDFDRPTAQAIATLVRERIRHVVREPAILAHEWLESAFVVLEEEN
ncbi:LysR family transcriptional regulator [Amaricoccus macauensis]|uniref:LysR family transcriptional regulator n=1 Tax=Amaricoccus macauensis TaxID=57001 RepID=UPI003C7AC841